MKIKVIGSGSIYSSSNSASYLIDEDILIDIPNGACKNIKKINVNPSSINHVLITHFHGDHYFDIPFYLLEKLKNKELCDVYFYCDKSGKDLFKKLFMLGYPNRYEKVKSLISIHYINTDNFKVNNYNVSRYLVDHGKMKPAYGYVFDDGSKRVGFTGDTCINSNVIYMASICDALICDCSFIEGNNKHMGINDIELLASKYPNCKFYASHLSDEVKEALKDNKHIHALSDYEILDI